MRCAAYREAKRLIVKRDLTRRLHACSLAFPFPALALILSCSLAAGCTQLAKSLIELSRLQAAIIKEFGDKDVNVNLNNSSYLTVTFINSPLNDKSPEERAKRAEQTAAFVNQHYPLINQIEEIWVGFVRAETRFIVVNYTQSLDVFGFDKNGRPLPTYEEVPPASAPDSSLQPIAVYSPDLKQTEVSITSLQLQGNINKGLAVSPHFAVPGDATGVRRSATNPKSVSFDFGSYSDKSLFPGEPNIKFLADGKVVFETKAQFSTSKNTDGLFSEIVMLQVPYPAFRRLTMGNKLAFQLGDYEYNLTEAQVKALRGMTDYVRN